MENYICYLKNAEFGTVIKWHTTIACEHCAPNSHCEARNDKKQTSWFWGIFLYMRIFKRPIRWGCFVNRKIYTILKNKEQWQKWAEHIMKGNSRVWQELNFKQKVVYFSIYVCLVQEQAVSRHISTLFHMHFPTCLSHPCLAVFLLAFVAFFSVSTCFYLLSCILNFQSRLKSNAWSTVAIFLHFYLWCHIVLYICLILPSHWKFLAVSRDCFILSLSFFSHP